MARKQRKRKALIVLAPILATIFFFTFLMLAISLSYTAANNLLTAFHGSGRELLFALKTRLEGITGGKKD